ncbi:hypothetical protein EJ05DRAFT_441139 [Pseudovirgaria hyperparasitica]|uniref:C2H2-type domain-containing protein n=1 Tax=Pseudovirgaria hyperparasitica TaxID=470096 RepID=A0A6A6W4B3_9PEZI|nr:uncharacterized protein EJ05DRAFT_441139 [Pseudovirgaria hyperparasitica]KAF2756750.1 hypothetical protein EJ05DRAFT_441139 [Pseudovirgaria hyperparasitica]
MENRFQDPSSLNSSRATLSSVNKSGIQLISPSLTTSSSPASHDHQAAPTFATNELTSHGLHLNAALQKQQGPALTNSPANTMGGVQNPNHLTSPIVRIDYSHGDHSDQHDMGLNLTLDSGKRSAQHLSPYANESSDDEIENTHGSINNSYAGRSISVPVPERNDDGSWATEGANSQAGISPIGRSRLNEQSIVSLKEQEEQILLAGKNKEVEEWLSHSDVGSDVEGPVRRKIKDSNRRRARSFNDIASQAKSGTYLGLGVQTAILHDRSIPGPGVYIDERSEYDEDDEEGERVTDVSLEDDEMPFNPESVNSSSYFPASEQDFIEAVPAKPWADSSWPNGKSSDRYQPPTSNQAMSRFITRAKEVDHASLAATVGSSRRRSESELGSLYGAVGISKPVAPTNLAEARGKPKEKRERRPSILESIIKRKDTNALKRKGSQPSPSQPAESGQANTKNAQGIATPPKRKHSWSSKGPRVDTSPLPSQKDLGLSTGPNLPTTSGPLKTLGKVIQRHRSRSDLGKSPGLATLMTQHGGPPMLSLASPLADNDTKFGPPALTTAVAAKDEEDSNAGDDIHEMHTMDLKIRNDPIIPTAEGFKTHARQLNPRLVEYMVERVTQEQMRRYKRLLDFKVKHCNAVRHRNCSAQNFCLSLGGESKILPPRASNKDGDAPFVGFQITTPGSSDEDLIAASEGTVVAAQFPPGVPLPPVKRLPAEFECPLCFKVKKFNKPSDWTKHVHEDVQPFTCTFPNCGEPKSFKRKADWVRHENERHRQLENWTCNIGDCTHTCYRKDNFVQHLVREHKLPEPRARTGRASNTGANGHIEGSGPYRLGISSNDPSDDVWALVERCRRDTAKQPKDEPCRFCGNICTSWKKLTVHLAKHMEQISMPILPLVEQKHVNADTIVSPVVDIPQHSDQIHTPSRSPASHHGPHSAGPRDHSYPPQFLQRSTATAMPPNDISTYPPPQLHHMVSQSQGDYPSYSRARDANTQHNAYTNVLPVSGPSWTESSQINHAPHYAPQPPPITPVSGSGFGSNPVYESPTVETHSLPGPAYAQQCFPTTASNSTSGAGDVTMRVPSHVGYGQSANAFQQSDYQLHPYMSQQEQAGLYRQY